MRDMTYKDSIKFNTMRLININKNTFFFIFPSLYGLVVGYKVTYFYIQNAIVFKQSNTLNIFLWIHFYYYNKCLMEIGDCHIHISHGACISKIMSWIIIIVRILKF